MEELEIIDYRGYLFYISKKNSYGEVEVSIDNQCFVYLNKKNMNKVIEFLQKQL